MFSDGFSCLHFPSGDVSHRRQTVWNLSSLLLRHEEIEGETCEKLSRKLRQRLNSSIIAKSGSPWIRFALSRRGFKEPPSPRRRENGEWARACVTQTHTTQTCTTQTDRYTLHTQTLVMRTPKPHARGWSDLPRVR